MSKNKDHVTPAAGVEKKDEIVAEAVVDAAAHESVVDNVFDAVTAWAAKGLGLATRGLEASARWLDARAKVVGDLATKLGSTTAGA